MDTFQLRYQEEDYPALLEKWKNDVTFKREYEALQWEIYKFNLNKTIMEERKNYLATELYLDKRCEQDNSLPEELIQEYLVNGTNLKCPPGTESDRASWCIGQCVINIASKEPVSKLNPVVDVI